MSPWCAELYDSRRTTVASTNGSPRRARSAASSSSSARIASASFDPGHDPLEVLGNVEVGERGGRPLDFDGLSAVRFHHSLAAAVSLEGAQLAEERAAVEDGRSQHVAVGRD